MKKLAAFLFLLVLFAGTKDAKAANLKFDYYDYMQQSIVHYDGKSPGYFVNSQQLNVKLTPAIINDRGIAMAPAETVFRDGMGGSAYYSPYKNKVLIRYGGNVLILKLNSTQGTLNGYPIEASCESYLVEYKDSGKKTVFVPTRFVAETLGCSYLWNSWECNVYIKAPLKLNWGGNDIEYYDKQAGVTFDGTTVNLNDTPTFLVNDIAMINVEKVLANDPKATYYYDQALGKVLVERGEITIVFELNSVTTYINDVLDYAPVAPAYVYNYSSKKGAVYLPGSYVFKTLGYSYNWYAKELLSKVKTTNSTGVASGDYDQVRTINSDKSAGNHYDTSGKLHKYFQEVNIPIPDDIDPKTVTVNDDFFNNLVTFSLKGDYRNFYKEARIRNNGNAVTQIQILYYPSSKNTVVKLITATDSAKHILGFKMDTTDSGLHFIFDTPKNLYGKVIVIDPGHGDTNTGTVNEGIIEKNVNLSIVMNHLKPILDKTDIKVYYTRTTDSDPTLRERAALGARLEADMFISVHQNNIVGYPDFSGTTTFHGATVDQKAKCGLKSSEMAKIFHQNMLDSLGFTDRGVKDHDYDVTLYNEIPAVLLECGYMSNHEELEKLLSDEYQEKIAQAIVKSIKDVYAKYDFSL